MRASVACEKCRRSKIKCIHDDLNGPCRACSLRPGRECVYPPSATDSQRSDSLASANSVTGKRTTVDGEVAPQKRARKANPQTSYNAPLLKAKPDHVSSDPLDAQLLTPQVWRSLFDIFQQHFATDLPFLHAPTFLKPLQQADPYSPSQSRPPFAKVVLLAFLTLTASFHPSLRSHHTRSSDDKSTMRAASEYYYGAACEEMKEMIDDSKSFLARIQAQLMLGMYEWVTCRGSKSWRTVGDAIRSAHQFCLHVDNVKVAQGFGFRPPEDPTLREDESNKPKTKEEEFIDAEIRRRTFWSCFIMDRYLSGGINRPRNVLIKEVRIQLPCNEMTFRSGKTVKTRFFTSDVAQQTAKFEDPQPETPSQYYGSPNHGRYSSVESAELCFEEESILSIYIRAMELFGRVFQWSVEGGRRVDGNVPPWDPRSNPWKFSKELKAFEENLPSDLTLSTHNTEAHATSGTSTTTPYTLIHILLLLCHIMLHREYIPWIALNCREEGPKGPLDEPRFPEEQYGKAFPTEGYGNIREFWKESARKGCRAARDITELLYTCMKWQRLAETPLVMFAEYQSKIYGIYGFHFPWMDTEKHYKEMIKHTNLLQHRVEEWPMVAPWWKTLIRLHNHYRQIMTKSHKNMYNNTSDSTSECSGSSRLSVSDGGPGGGLNEYISEEWETKLKSFGDHRRDKGEDNDLDNGDLIFDEAIVMEMDESDASVHRTPDPRHMPLPSRQPRRPDTLPNFTAVNQAGVHAVSGMPNGTERGVNLPSVRDTMPPPPTPPYENHKLAYPPIRTYNNHDHQYTPTLPYPPHPDNPVQRAPQETVSPGSRQQEPYHQQYATEPSFNGCGDLQFSTGFTGYDPTLYHAQDGQWIDRLYYGQRPM